MLGFDTALDGAVGTTTAMIASLGGKGIVITLAVITAGLVIIFIKMGWRKGLHALQGKTR